MTSVGRRKHSSCLLRIRESCPLRKLRKNKCSVSSSSEAAGRRWGNSQATVSALANYAETHPQTLSVQPFYHHHHQQHHHHDHQQHHHHDHHHHHHHDHQQHHHHDQQQHYHQHRHQHPNHHHQLQGDHSAMDAEAAPSVTGSPFSSFSASAYTGPVSSASNLMRLHQSSLSTSDPSMELDSSVDPETGESTGVTKV